MRIFIESNNTSPDQSVRQALDVLFNAGVYSVQGGGTISNRALILIDVANAPEAIAVLTKAGMRTAIDRAS